MVKQHHIFLSYSRVDLVIMQRVRDDLRHAGLQVWTDEGIEPGTVSWKEAIEQAIREAEMIVVLMSPDSNNSKWVQREIDYADVQGVKVMPLLVRGEPRDAVPFALAGAQFIDVRTNFKAGLQSLISNCYEHMHSSSGVTVEYVVSPKKKGGNRPVWLNRTNIAIGILPILLIICGLAYYGATLEIGATDAPTPSHTPSATTQPTTAVAVIVESPSSTPTHTRTPSPTATQATATPTQTNTPTQTFTPSPSPTPAGELQLRYNRNSLVVYNRSGQTTTILGLEFALITEDGINDRYIFTANEWSAANNRLLAEQCVQVWRTEFAELPLNLPVSNVCDTRAAFQSTIRQFWIADWDDAYFEVRRFGILLTSCPAVQLDDNTNHFCLVDV